jgi:hypothetical protein
LHNLISLVEYAKRNKKKFKESPKHPVIIFLFIHFIIIIIIIIIFFYQFWALHL